jgi:pimeloyl-ACP methyl ester carboxylesterase
LTSIIVLLAFGLLVAFLLLRLVFPEHLVALMLSAVRRFAGLRACNVDVDGVTWPYLDGGLESGEIVILLHGFGGDKDNWPFYARHLRKEFRVIAPDLPGFGENGRDLDPNADYRISTQVRRLRKFVEAMGIDRFHIAGNSMGGYLALEYALAYPSSVITMMLLNNAGVSSINKSEVELAASRGENLLVVSSFQELDKLLKLIVYRPMPIPGVVKQHIGRQLIDQRGFLDRIFWSLYDDNLNRPLDDQLHNVSAPTLIIWGRCDRVIDVSCTEIMQQRIPQNQCIVFDKIGHVPMLECAAHTASAHRDFINQHRAA